MDDRQVISELRLFAREGVEDNQARMVMFMAADELEGLYGLLERIKQACLFEDDNGTMVFSNNAHLPAGLFEEVCDALQVEASG